MPSRADVTAWGDNLRGRAITETKVISGMGGGTFVTAWGYDSANRVVWQKYPGGSGGQVGEVVNYTYNARGRLKTVSGASVYVTNTWYNPLGQVTDRLLGPEAGVRQNYSYSAAEDFRLVSLQSGVSPTYTNTQNITYSYDDTGNVLSIADSAAYGGSQTQTFTYYDNALNQLWTAQATGGTGYGDYAQRSYAYDNTGNITSFEGTAFAYNDAAHKHAVTHLGGVQKYWYDANGNATRRIAPWGTDISLSYDAENRLITVSGG